jgi:hypothetical protein
MWRLSQKHHISGRRQSILWEFTFALLIKLSNHILIEEFNEISSGVQLVFVSNLSYAKKLVVTNIVLEILEGKYLCLWFTRWRKYLIHIPSCYRQINNLLASILTILSVFSYTPNHNNSYKTKYSYHCPNEHMRKKIRYICNRHKQ